jgi:hypothetical protein
VFEEQVARQLIDFDAEATLFFVQVFSWRTTPMPTARALTSHLPKTAELAQDRCIGFHEISDKTTVKVAIPTLMFTDEAQAGDIQISTRKVSFSRQLLIVVGCRQVDHDAGHASLRGASDVIGLLSLIFGRRICEVPVISEYFNVSTKKFVSSTLALTAVSGVEEMIAGLTTFYGLDCFDGMDNTTHAALWFAGKAFTEIDRASKIVFLHTAMELVCGKRMQDHFRNLYKGRAFVGEAIEAIDALQDLRGQLVHKGLLGGFSSAAERYAQLLLLDALVARQHGSLPASAFETGLYSFRARHP